MGIYRLVQTRSRQTSVKLPQDWPQDSFFPKIDQCERSTAFSIDYSVIYDQSVPSLTQTKLFSVYEEKKLIFTPITYQTKAHSP